MADTSNIEKLLKMASSSQKPSAAQPSKPVAAPIPQPAVNLQTSPEMIDYAKEQIYQNLKKTQKPISKMTDTEKIIFAEKEQAMIEDYEMFMHGQEQYTMAQYSGKGDVFFSPVASTVLDDFFTDGKH